MVDRLCAAPSLRPVVDDITHFTPYWAVKREVLYGSGLHHRSSSEQVQRRSWPILASGSGQFFSPGSAPSPLQETFALRSTRRALRALRGLRGLRGLRVPHGEDSAAFHVVRMLTFSSRSVSQSETHSHDFSSQLHRIGQGREATEGGLSPPPRAAAEASRSCCSARRTLARSDRRACPRATRLSSGRRLSVGWAVVVCVTCLVAESRWSLI